MSEIPFESFVSLVERLGDPPVNKKTPTTKLAPDKIFASWLASQRQPIVRGSGKRIFRLLFPFEGTRRRYGMKETTLARELGKILCVQGPERWDSVRWEGAGGSGTGCLGKEVEWLMKRRISSKTRSTLTIGQVDSLLDVLAAPSAFSQLSQQPASALTTHQVLTKLYRDSDLTALALAVLTQIILQDLRPLLNPLPRLPARNPTALLAVKSNEGPKQLGLLPAMRMWDGKMAEMYRGGKGSVDWCADKVDELGGGFGSKCRESVPAGPIVGVNVQIPKCEKGRSVESALNEFTGNQYHKAASVVWAETKYDGYRMQIHVEIISGRPVITIFSKSKRNSTVDRGNTHSIILASLGLPFGVAPHRHSAMAARVPSSGSKLRQSVILEAEVVPYNEGERAGGRGPGIEEFWLLDKAGVVSADAPGFRSGGSKTADTNRHLCLAFFDILHLDGKNLLNAPYSQRRHLLESTIRTIPGFAILCARTPINLSLGRASAVTSLQSAFDQACARGEEGLILKSPESRYNSTGHRWVKLKKDYIPDHGDCIDLVLLGAGWDIDRARDLRVDTSVYTTWYIGVLVNRENVREKKQAPHFEVISRVSYGSTRDELEVYNANIRMGRWGTKAYDKDDPSRKRLIGLSWTFTLPKTMPPPSVLFEDPLCAEVMGGGFQKLPQSQMYELRWPRMKKIHPPAERTWPDALDGPSLVQAAHKALGYAPRALGNAHEAQLLSSPANDSLHALWDISAASAVDILPDTPSPDRRALSGLAMRARSAPDLGEISKVSPPTPRHARRSPIRPARSPLWNMASPRQAPVEAPGRKMREAIGSSSDGSQQQRAEGKKPSPYRFGDYLVHPTPLSSPAKRTGSPLFTPSPEKRANRAEIPAKQYGNLMQTTGYLNTPPPTSPILSSLDMNVDALPDLEEEEADEDKHGEEKEKEDLPGEDDAALAQVPILPSSAAVGGATAAGTSGSTVTSGAPAKVKWRKGMPMSLRSRIKLAMRGIVRSQV